MGRSAIEWTDETWNPVTGCTKVSQGCKHCYAERVAERFWKGRKFTDVQTHADRLDQPLRWRKPRRVFVNSMSDLFHEAVHRDFILRVFLAMQHSPRHSFQILTKRPERMRDLLRDWMRPALQLADAPRLESPVWPLPNVWLGVSCEDQETADARIPLLLDTPAAVRFVSCEPLLGPIKLDGEFDHHRRDYLLPSPIVDLKRNPWESVTMRPPLDWIIVGGESGPGARPCDVAWIRSIVEQCKAAGVPCFVKQVGARPVAQHPMQAGALVDAPCADPKGGDPDEWPKDLRVREWPAQTQRGEGAG